MSRRIYVTEADIQKLKKLVDDEMDNTKDRKHVLDLGMELARAEVVAVDRLPDDVITMNSKVLLSVDGAEEEVWLVYPHEANVAENKISVLSPIGTAILGYRERDRFEWSVPGGTANVEVIKVIYQPEAAEKRR
jgi:regulator of nucleoside diphosphate kinase